MEHGEDCLDILVHLWRGGLAKSKVTLAYVGGAGSCDQGFGQRLPADMFVVGPPVNVDDIARAMLHCLRLCCGTRWHWSPAQRGGNCVCVAKWGGQVGEWCWWPGNGECSVVERVAVGGRRELVATQSMADCSGQLRRDGMGRSGAGNAEPQQAWGTQRSARTREESVLVWEAI